MFKVNNVFIVNFEHISHLVRSSVSIVNFEKVNAGWVMTLISFRFLLKFLSCCLSDVVVQSPVFQNYGI